MNFRRRIASRLSCRISRRTFLGPTMIPSRCRLHHDAPVSVVSVPQCYSLNYIAQLHLRRARFLLDPVAIETSPAHPRQVAHPLNR